MRRSPRAVVYVAAGLIGLALAQALMQMPVQRSDSLAQLLNVQQSPSAAATFIETAQRGAYLRPMFITTVHVLFDVAQGHYWLVYRGFHALLILAAVLLFVRALRVESWADCSAAVFAVTVFTGLHTFRGLVREAYPISHFLIIVVLCLAALNLARSRGGMWVDVAAIAAFLIASLTIESGLLVWVIVVTAWATGMRGVSGRAVVVMTALLGAYFWVRFGWLSTGAPTLLQRSSGFLLEILDPEELDRRFGANPLGYYAYNVVTSALSILFSDPDGGVFEIARAWVRDDIPPRLFVAVVSSLLATGLIAWSVTARRRRGPAECPPAYDQLLLVAAAVLFANSVMSYAYTKHEIISVAGTFYAVAVYAATRHALEYLGKQPHALARTLAIVMLALTASIWAFRSAGVHHMLRQQAFKERNDWANVVMPSEDSPVRRQQAALIRDLRSEALELRMANPHALPRWMDRWWGE